MSPQSFSNIWFKTYADFQGHLERISGGDVAKLVCWLDSFITDLKQPRKDVGMALLILNRKHFSCKVCSNAYC